jgi:hypothetical protein
MNNFEEEKSKDKKETIEVSYQVPGILKRLDLHDL